MVELGVRGAPRECDGGPVEVRGWVGRGGGVADGFGPCDQELAHGMAIRDAVVGGDADHKAAARVAVELDLEKFLHT